MFGERTLIKEEPEIVKILRREEILRKSNNKIKETSQNIEISINKPICLPDVTKSIINEKAEEENNIKTSIFLLDEIDEAIIQLVKINRWIAPSTIARVIGCSPTAIRYRIYALYKEGLIPNYKGLKRTRQSKRFQKPK